MQRTIDIVNSLDLEKSKKELFRYLAERFDDGMPDTLYMNYYELAKVYQGTHPDSWEEFLDTPEINRYVQAKIAKLQEFAALKALKQLEQKSTYDNAGAVAALKEILEKSKLIQQSVKRKQRIVLTYMPERSNEDE